MVLQWENGLMSHVKKYLVCKKIQSMSILELQKSLLVSSKKLEDTIEKNQKESSADRLYLCTAFRSTEAENDSVYCGMKRCLNTLDYPFGPKYVIQQNLGNTK